MARSLASLLLKYKLWRSDCFKFMCVNAKRGFDEVMAVSNQLTQEINADIEWTTDDAYAEIDET
jgi:hypothetical protein